MLLLNYSIPENYIPPEIYKYTDNERYLLLLFGNSIIQTIKNNTSLENENEYNENPIVKKLTDKYTTILKEKEDIITQLEMSKRISAEVYGDLIETEKSKINEEIQKELFKERQYIEEKTKLLKDHYDETIFSLKNDKEKMSQAFEEQNEKIKLIENEKIKLEEKIKYDDQSIKSRIEQERIKIRNELYGLFQIENTKIKEENEEKTQNMSIELRNMERLLDSLKNEKEIYILKIKQEYEIKEKEQNESLKNENISLKTEIQTLISEKERERYETLNETFEKNQSAIFELHKTIEEIKQQTTKKSLSQDIGKEGENYFFDLASEIFNHMDDFEIEDKTHQGHMGDFFLKFKEFTILVDVKNFNTSKVGVTDLKKFKSDARRNPQIKIAWMVSLNKGISTYDTYPVEVEYDNGVLFCYINSLFFWEENQKKILISTWRFCKEIYINFFDKENENTERIAVLLKRDNNKKLIAERGKKRIKELKGMVEQMKNTIYELEKDLIEIIKGDVLMENDDKLNSLKNWFSQTMIREESKKNKMDIVNVFEKYKDTIEDGHPETVENFLVNLKTFIDDSDFSKNKTKGSKKYILNYKWVV